MDSFDEGEPPSSDTKHVSDKNKKRAGSQVGTRAKKVKYDAIPGSNIKKLKLKNDEKPPTFEELNNLKTTENLFNNNLFRLQIEELIKEVAIKNKRKKALASWINESLKSTLDSLPELEVSLSDIKPLQKKKMSKLEQFIKTLSVNYRCPFNTDQDIALKLKKPDSYECFGLYENDSLPGPYLEVSINVTMPRTYFHLKDFLNNRYLVKRYYYLAYIATQISACKTSFVLHDNNCLLPVLHVQPIEDEKLTVKIYVTPNDSFKGNRFLPEQNNVKEDLFESNFIDKQVLKDTATIWYNSALAHDVTLSENSAFIKTTLTDRKNVQEGIKLLCIWLKQRELHVGFGGFTEDLVLYFVVYLLCKKHVNNYMSSYQVARNFWTYLSNLQLVDNPISFTEVPASQLEAFNKAFDLVFLDVTGCFNLTSFLDKQVFEKVQQECKLALKHLDDTSIESFRRLFLTKVPFLLQYDIVLDVTEALPLTSLFTIPDSEKAKRIGYDQFCAVHCLKEMLRQGLSSRVTHIVPRFETVDDLSARGFKKVMFGLNLNAETAFNFIEKGPELSDFQRADEFRQFWSYLASDRRFRDGSANVAVYFKTKTIRSRRGIVKRIIKYLLMEKLNVEFKLYYDEFEDFLLNKMVEAPYPIGTNEDACLKVVAIADELGQRLRSVPMSLSITGIQGASDTFSYCQPFPPIAAKCKWAEGATDVRNKSVIFSTEKSVTIPRYMEPLELVLHLEHSSKWPNDLEAVRHVKTSFYLEISKMLSNSHNIISHVTRDYLEVFYQGLVFRYRVFIAKELALIKKEITETGTTKYADNTASLDLQLKLDVLPKVNAALKGLQSQFPSFGPGTALIKRWLRSHLIDDSHLPDVVINLLNASLYVNLTNYAESCTPQVSFLRFLKFLAEFHWELQPVIVNFNEEISKEDLADLEAQFQKNRTVVQPLYIIIPYDQGQSLYTKKVPTKEVLAMVKQLASVALGLIVERVMGPTAFDLTELFKPNLEGYNLVIHLRPLLNPRRHEQIGNTSDDKIVLEQYKQHSNEKIPIVGFNPVEIYLRELRECYGDYAMFFHDSYGGNFVAVLWNPRVIESKDFKISHIHGRKLVNDKLEFNEEAAIEDFYLLGNGIVKWIEKR